MSPLVVDASIALTWCFDDEASSETDAIFERVRDDGAVVPGLWYLELANVLLQAERQGRIAPGDAVTRLALITQLPIVADVHSETRTWRDVLPLARAEGLTIYDAAYLELAVRRGLWLSTRDKALRGAAVRIGVAVLP